MLLVWYVGLSLPSPQLAAVCDRRPFLSPWGTGTAADSRTSWAEVYLPGQCCWVPLHLPSSSVGQPQLCEGSCPRKLAYVLAVEHGGWVGQVAFVLCWYACGD